MVIDVEALGASLTLLLSNYGITRDQAADLLGGPHDGGPNGNGLYPITTAGGVTIMAPSPLKLLASGVAVDPAILQPLVANAEASREAAVVAAAAAKASAAAIDGTVQITQTNTNPAKIVASKAAGTTIRAVGTEIVLRAAYARGVDDGGVELQIDGFNAGDPRQVLREDGSQIEPLAWAVGQRLSFYFDGAAFRLIEPARAAANTNGASEYQQIALSHARMGV